MATEPRPAVSAEMPVSCLDDRAVQQARHAASCRKRKTPRKADPTMRERIYSREEEEFLQAMAAYQQQTGRKFPTWTEVLQVLKNLGYCKPPVTAC